MAKPKHWMHSIDEPSDFDILIHIGKFFRVKDDKGNDKVVEAENIVGSLVYPTKCEIHSKGEAYLLSFLDFFAQVNNEHITDDQIKKFDDTQFHIQATGDNKSWQQKKKKPHWSMGKK